jgi:ligand-binding sensor domain-containing protein/signal transduction histidine kinase
MRRCGFLTILILLGCVDSTASETAPPDAPAYSRRVWRSADGLPEDFAQSLAQTQDGYLWIGTSGGLARFDGMSFVVFNRENTPAFLDDSVYSLLVTKDGTLWAGTEGGGIVRYKDGRFRAFGVADGLTNGFVRVIYEDRNDRLWVGTDAGLFRMQNESLIRVDGRDGAPKISAHAICEDRAGRLLVGGRGLLILRGTESAYYTSNESLADNSIRTIRQTADGALWIGTISGLRRLDQGVNGDPFMTPKILNGANISVLLESRSGELWIGAYGQGLMRFQSGRIIRFSAPSSLPHNNVLALFEDNEDNVWVGAQGGLLRLSLSAASTITTADGAPLSINTIYKDPRGDLFVTALNGKLFRVARQTLAPVRLPAALSRMSVRNVFRDSRGALWLGADGQGVARIDAREIVGYTMKQGLVNDFIRAFCEDREGGVWIGTDSGLSRFHQGAFQNFNTDSGLAYGSIRALLLDRGGDLWVATDGGLSRFHAGRFVADPSLERLRGQKVWSLCEDAEGKLWIGTHGAGLFLLKDGTMAQFTTKDGLPSNKIHFIVEDAQGSLWMSGPSGVVAVSRREIESLSVQGAGQPAVRVYSTAEGLSTNQMNGGVQPAGVMLASGEMWFPSAKGAVRIEHGAQDRRSAPPALIERVLADDRDVPFSKHIILNPGRGKLEIHYTAIRLRSPDRIRFKFRMENFDQGWTDAGQRRVAYYTNLPAGKYRFRVVAYEIDDPRSATEQVLSVEWRPHFYKTAWFPALCGFAALAVVWGWYRLHVRNLRQRFAAVLEERNRLAREMHDTLIQGCVGVSALLEAASSAREVSPSISDELLDRARNEVRATVDEARLAVWNLRQNADEGLAPAISQLTRRLSLETGIPISFESNWSAPDLGAENERSLLMIVREALQNALRHADPDHVSVALTSDHRGLRVEIEDDGRGFDSSIINSSNGRHYGLVGMRERAEKLGGRLSLTSSPGKGTQVRLSVPKIYDDQDSSTGRRKYAEVKWNADDADATDHRG